ncbi:T3SS (YopN, CesT) and YbjN peptide-binding chaperone 1 [Flexivirga sp.]|uniref:T3SS (YopN, CesT) and YbjN peptide-binding chaperone 1 n=1 Tax=Flexivirga sp. TaxID=1962927 RepID=UPI003F817539
MFDADDSLQLYIPRFAEVDPWVIDIHTVPEDQVIRIDYTWDEVYLRADDPADTIHRMRTVLEGGRFRISHPQLLTVSADGPAAAGVGILGLGVRGTVPSLDDEAVPSLVTSNRDQLLGALLAHARTAFDDEIELDEDEDLPLFINGVRLWAGVPTSKPSIMLFTRVVDNVHSRRQACVDVNVLNRSNLWSRWVVRDHSVWQHLSIPSFIFQPDVFDEMLQLFTSDYRSTQLDLADRLGGQPASG